MFFTAIDNRNMSEDAIEQLHLYCNIKLKKLRWKLIEEEEVERSDEAHKQVETISGGGTNVGQFGAKTQQADDGDQEHEDLTQVKQDQHGKECITDAWSSQADDTVDQYQDHEELIDIDVPN